MNTSTTAAQKIAIILMMLVVGFGLLRISQASASTIVELDGYMWSSTIGWISLNCKTGSATSSDICKQSPYRVYTTGGTSLYGYAWSSNVGWIKFNGLSGFPTGSETVSASARFSGTSPNLTFEGWARACAGTLSGDCSTMVDRTDGWDGWISLKGTGYGITTRSGGTVNTSGFFWGGSNVGWIGGDAIVWDQVTGDLTGTDCKIAHGAATCGGKVSWTFSPTDITSPIVEQKTPANVTTVINGASPLTSTNKSVTLSYGTTTYTAKSGTVVLDTLPLGAVCAEAGDTLVAGVCDFNTALPVAVTLTASNKFVRSGGSVNLDWTIEGMDPRNLTQCTLKGPNVSGNPISDVTGSLPVDGLKSYSTFTLTCDRGVGYSDSATVNVEVIPTVTEN